MMRLIFLSSFISLWAIMAYGQQRDSVINDGFICTFEPPASFPGGYDALYNFIRLNLKYPKCTKNCLGKVFIEFTINEDGSLSDFRVIKGLCDICNKNALEALKKMPNWVPAKMKNNPIRTKMIIPIKFNL